jgi:hypothetical protein
MAKEKPPGAGNDWDAGDSPSQSAPVSAVTQTAASPASPAAPGKTWTFPPNASRDDCLRIKADAEAALKDQPDYPAAKQVLATATDRLRYFTESGQLVRPAAERGDAGKYVFPDNAKDARELHAKLKRQPVKTIRERDSKRALLAKLGAHIAALESGLPTINLHANDHAAMYAQRDAGVKRAKLEMLARQIPEIKSLLADHDALKGAYETIGAVNKEISTRIDALLKENAELNELLKKA